MSKFVIYTPEHKDYLAAFSEKKIDWNGELREANFFRTFEQAQRVAKGIVAQMRNHPAPYSLFIREVNEKNGQWKIKGEIEVEPEPDRAAFYRQHPEYRGQVDTPPSSKPDICPVKYVIYQQSQNDYLASVKESGNFEKTSWSARPQDAIGYTTLADAERKATELVDTKGYALTVCELHETEDQYWTKALKHLSPMNASLN